jgi:hypothetical protein
MYSNEVNYEARALEQRSKSGARWFFWIAGLSIMTSIVSLFGGGFAFSLASARLSLSMAWPEVLLKSWVIPPRSWH